MFTVEMKSETRVLRQSVEQGELMTATLEHQLKEKHNEISDLHNTVERLQKEKRQLLVELNHIQSLLPQQGLQIQCMRLNITRLGIVSQDRTSNDSFLLQDLEWKGCH